MMRSIVKKSLAQPQAYAGLANNGRLLNNNMLQAFGSNIQYGMGPNIMRDGIATHDQFPQQARQMYPPFNNQGGDGIMNSSGVMSSNNFPHGNMGMTSTDMFRAGLRLERMEQREQQQRQMQTIDMFNNSNAAPAAASFNPPPAMALKNNYGSSSNHGEMSEVEVAFQIMKQDPSVEPWRALELAKRFNNK